MKFISLFAGIGGFDLGLERAGMTCVGQVEIDPYCNRVLAKHWPDVPRWRDITQLDGKDLPECDLMCGGFPCQDISSAGTKAGIDGEQSGLWSEYVRLIRGVRPRYVIVENVADMLIRGLDRVLGDLAECGYDTEWVCIPAGLLGAVHRRSRLFVVGYANEGSELDRTVNGGETPRLFEMGADPEHTFASLRGTLGRVWGQRESLPWDEHGECVDSSMAVRVDDGISHRLDRLRGLGNAIVPQVAEVVGRAILDTYGRETRDQEQARSTV